MTDSVNIDVGEVSFLEGVGSGEVSGQMTSVGSVGKGDSNEYNTLDEPVKDTVMRDVRAVGNKFFHVLYPKERKSLLKEWDLWGPLIICTILATVLQGGSALDDEDSGHGPQFAEVFIIVWGGAAAVTLNIKLLRGNISFFQSVCVLGYCLLPLLISLFLCRVLLFLPSTSVTFMARFCTAAAGFAWSTYASTIFLGDCHPPARTGLAVYPIFLFYFVISWLVLSHTA